MRALLVTIGTLGDLHPFIAIGQALVRQGADVCLAVPLDHVAKVEAAGLKGVAILPSFADICARIGIDEAEAVRRTLDDRDFVLDQVLLPSLGMSAKAIDALAADADVVVGSIFALAAGLVAERRGLPLIDVVLQPMAMFSAWQPPLAPGFEPMRHAPRSAVGRGWNRVVFGIARQILRRRYARSIDAVRAEIGLAPARSAPLIEASPARVRTICAYSPTIARIYPDAPADTHVTGFAQFDSESGAPEALDPGLAAFLDAGDPPIVFSLGSFAWAAAGDFYAHAAEASRRLGRRAVLLTGGGQGGFARDGDIATIGYAPHSQLFGRCTAIVHHGGIGTVGQALRAGRPQLIVPHFGDQHDNAERIRRLGVGATIKPQAFTADSAAGLLRQILADEVMLDKARSVGCEVLAEDGAGEAARRIQELVR